MKDTLAKRIVEFFQEIGVNPLYAITMLCVLITLTYRNDFKSWAKLPRWNKGLAASSLLASIVLITFSILSLLGIAEF